MRNRNHTKKHVKSTKNNRYLKIPKIEKETDTNRSWKRITNSSKLLRSSREAIWEQKNKEKPLKTEEIASSAKNNDKSDDNDSTITTIRPEKGTIMGLNTAPADEEKDLGLDKTNNNKKEEVESSGEEDGFGPPNKINVEIKDIDDQESYFNNGTEEATNMGADTEVTKVEVQSSGQNNVESSNKTVAEKSKSNKEQGEENKQVTTNTINNETEEATIMEADTVAIGIETQSDLLNHVVGFHESGATASKRVKKEEVNKVVNSKNMFEKEAGNEEKATNMEISEEKVALLTRDKQ